MVMNFFFLLPVSFVLAFLGSLLIIRQTNSRQWLDSPNSRSSHTVPTPTGGGVAIVIVFILSSLVLFTQKNPGFNHFLVLVFGGCIATLGLADDVFNLGIRIRISVQFLVVAGALALFGIPPVPLPTGTIELGFPGFVLAACGLLWFINLFNFMDGIDGLAASEFVFVCLSVFIIALVGDNSGLRELSLILIASVCGFLALNIAPARLFMGDVGSNFLGYMLGLLALSSCVLGLTTLWVWCILSGLFVIDATNTLLSRMLKGETWYFAHRTHAYQLAAKHFGSHGKVVLIAMLINCIWLFPLAWLAHKYSSAGLPLTLLAWIPLLILVRMIGNSQTFNRHSG